MNEKNDATQGTIDVVITPTHAAMVFANARGDVAGFKKATEEAIEEIGAGTDDGPDDIMDIFFHTFSWHGEYNFILTPAKDRSCMIVDLCEHEEGKEIKSGPMQGKRMMIPRPFSEGDAVFDGEDDDE